MSLLIVCRDPISRDALAALGPDITFTDPGEAIASVRANQPSAVLVDADEPGVTPLLAALSLATSARIVAFASRVSDGVLCEAGAAMVLRKPTGRTVLPGDPVMAVWRDAIGGPGKGTGA